MAQQYINYGNSANDGTGDPLRTAFIKTDNNFDQIWNAGPVGSNITIINNTVGVTNTNGNLILSPNGVGNVQFNRDAVPRLNNTYNLGAANLRWRSLSIGTGGINTTGNLTLGNIANLHIPGGNNGYVIQTNGAGNLSWAAQSGSGNGNPGGANTQIQYNDGGLFAGSVGFTFNKTSNVLSVPGNIQMGNTSGIYSSSAGYVVGLRMSNTEPSVKLVANNHEWQFNSNGVLKFPTPFSPSYPAITMTNSANLLIAGYQGVGYVEDGGNIIVSGGVSDSGNNGNATLFGQQVTVQTQFDGTSSTNNWSFNSDGSLSLPAGNIVGLGNVVGPGNISYPFGPGPVFLADNSANNNAYFALTAVANANGVLGYVGMANFGSNTAVGLIETNDGTGNTYDWYFQPDGRTSFPEYTFPNVDGTNGQVLTTDGSGSLSWANLVSGNSFSSITMTSTPSGPSDQIKYGTGNLVSWLDGGWVIGEYNGTTYGTEGVRISPGIEGNVEVNLPSNQGASENPLQLANYVGNVVINTGNGHQWTFNADGSLTPPAQASNNRTGTGLVLKLGNENTQAIITGPAPVANVYNAAPRLVIAGQDGLWNGEGGDIYLWAGQSGNTGGSGGDIKVDAGIGQNGSDGGTIKVRGGNSVGGTGGFIEIDGGYGAVGGPIYITGGGGNGGAGGEITLLGGSASTGFTGGNVTITGGTSADGLASYGNVKIAAGASLWKFDNTGQLTVPNDSTIKPISGTIGIATNDGNTYAWASDGGFYIDTAYNTAEYEWNFDPTGNLNLPQGGIIHETDIPFGGLSGKTIALAPYGGTSTDQQLLVYPTAGADANHLHLTSGNLWNTELFLGNDNLYVKLANTGDVVINSNDGSSNTAQWTFGTDGNLTTPGSSGNISGANVISAVTFSATGNIIAGNVLLVGNIGAASYASPAPSLNGFDSINAVTVSATGNITASNANISSTTPSKSKTTGSLTIAGGVGIAGNIYSNRSVTQGAYGNIILNEFTGVYNQKDSGTALIQTTTNALSAGVGILTTGVADRSTQLYSTGNLAIKIGVTTRSEDVPTGGSTVATITANGINVTGLASASGNVTGGNILTGGLISAAGNVTAANFIGNISITGNVTGTSPNVQLVAGSYTYTFDNTGNVTLPTGGDLIFSANTTMTSVSNGNITIDPNGTGQLIVTSTTPAQFGNSVTVAGNILLSSSTPAVFANQRKFDWTAMIHGTPATGGSITGSILGDATYSNFSDGVQLTANATGKSGSVAWNTTTFDFTKDFIMEWSWFTSSSGTTPADGVWATFGGSNNGSGGQPLGTTNGAIGLRYLTYTNLKTQWYSNGATTGNAVNFRAGVTYQGEWMTSKIMVRKVGSQRYAYVYTGVGGVCDNAIDITSWTPAGTWIAVGASTGGSTSSQLCCHVALEYL